MLLSKLGQSAACKQASVFRQLQDHTQQILHARPFSGQLAALRCSSRAYALRGYQQNTPRACYSVRRTLPTPDLISHLQNKKSENSNQDSAWISLCSVRLESSETPSWDLRCSAYCANPPGRPAPDEQNAAIFREKCLSPHCRRKVV